MSKDRVSIPEGALSINPMQKYIELLHWEWLGKINAKNRVGKHRTAKVQRYKPRSGFEKYVEKHILRLPAAMQKFAWEAAGTDCKKKPSSIDLVFTTFTPQMEYILYNDRARKLVEVMALMNFDSDSITHGSSQVPFLEEISVADVERYKYFFWNMDEMTVGDKHMMMAPLDTDDENMVRGYTLHVNAFYGRSTMNHVLMNLEINPMDLDYSNREVWSQNLYKMGLMVEDELRLASLEGRQPREAAINMMRSGSSIMQAINSGGEQDKGGELRGKLETPSVGEGYMEEQEKISKQYHEDMEKQEKGEKVEAPPNKIKVIGGEPEKKKAIPAKAKAKTKAAASKKAPAKKAPAKKPTTARKKAPAKKPVAKKATTTNAKPKTKG